MSVGGQPKYAQSFEPLPGNIEHVPFNDVAALEAAMGPDVCAFVVEPIQGESGVMPADRIFLQRARELTTQHDALLIFDEVQTGNAAPGICMPISISAWCPTCSARPRAWAAASRLAPC